MHYSNTNFDGPETNQLIFKKELPIVTIDALEKLEKLEKISVGSITWNDDGFNSKNELITYLQKQSQFHPKLISENDINLVNNASSGKWILAYADLTTDNAKIIGLQISIAPESFFKSAKIEIKKFYADSVYLCF
jgi:hypothetical protein